MGDVSATVINVISTKRDAEILKKLFSCAGEFKTRPGWLFIPTGLHLITSTDLVKQALREQLKYCSTISGITIEGISKHALEKGGDDGVSIQTQIKNNLKGLISIEQTIHSEKRGRWMFLVKKG